MLCVCCVSELNEPIVSDAPWDRPFRTADVGYGVHVSVPGRSGPGGNRALLMSLSNRVLRQLAAFSCIEETANTSLQQWKEPDRVVILQYVNSIRNPRLIISSK